MLFISVEIPNEYEHTEWYNEEVIVIHNRAIVPFDRATDEDQTAALMSSVNIGVGLEEDFDEEE